MSENRRNTKPKQSKALRPAVQTRGELREERLLDLCTTMLLEQIPHLNREDQKALLDAAQDPLRRASDGSRSRDSHMAPWKGFVEDNEERAGQLLGSVGDKREYTLRRPNVKKRIPLKM